MAANRPESKEYKESLDNLGIKREYQTMTVSRGEWHQKVMRGAEFAHGWVSEETNKWAKKNAPDWATHYVYDLVWYGPILTAVTIAYFDRKMPYEMETLK